jgi:hypothetical protein
LYADKYITEQSVTGLSSQTIIIFQVILLLLAAVEGCPKSFARIVGNGKLLQGPMPLNVFAAR